MRFKTLTEFSFKNYNYKKLYSMSKRKEYSFFYKISGVDYKKFVYKFKLIKQPNSIRIEITAEEDFPIFGVIVYTNNILKIQYLNTHVNNEYLIFRLFNTRTYNKKLIYFSNSVNIEISNFLVKENVSFKIIDTKNKSKFNNYKNDLVCVSNLERNMKLNINKNLFFDKLINYCYGFILSKNQFHPFDILIHIYVEYGEITLRVTRHGLNSKDVEKLRQVMQVYCNTHLQIKSFCWLSFTVSSEKANNLSDLDKLLNLYEFEIHDYNN